MTTFHEHISSRLGAARGRSAMLTKAVSGMGLFAFVCSASLLSADDAAACGGFFCSFNQPVNQQAERIIFVDHPDDTITAIVQVQYTGPSENFSWVVPVPGEPEVGVSSNVVFARLQQATNPLYTLNTEVEGTCADADRAFAPSPSFGAENDAAGGDGDGAQGDTTVNVISEGAVGPYNWQLIQVVPGAQDVAAVAVQWLTDNGYDVSGFGEELLWPYLECGMNLIGFKLEKDASDGEIRPITMRYAMDEPVVPIKLTAVAAEEDMGVMVFNLAETQAVPLNYRSLHLNEAAINWFNASSNYNDVVNLAANEAQGHGFVTEHAGPTEPLHDTIWSTFDEENWFSIQTDDWTFREQELMSRMWTYVAWDGLADAIRDHIPLPEGTSAESIAACPTCFPDGTVPSFDTGAFLSQVDDNVIQPIKATDDLFESRPYLTRMYTTLSADEMTEDPAFGFNAQLPDVDNNHNATRTIECNMTVTRNEAPWRVVLPQGTVVRGTGTTWPIDTDDVPAAFEIVQHERTGLGEIVLSNRQETQTLVDNIDPAATCACAAPTDRGAAYGALALVGLTALTLRRRRR